MRSELSGQRILVTRPKPQGKELCDIIQAAGGEPIYFPTIEIVPLRDPDFKNQIAGLDQFDWLIFISPQAVMQSVKEIQRAYPTFPSTIKIAAIGLGTAAKLREENFPVDACPIEDWSTEGLLALADFQSCEEKEIAVIKGLGGRDLLVDSLRARGALVTEILAYQRILPKAETGIIEPYLKDKTLDAVIVTSNESLENLETLIDKKYHAYLHTVPLVVMSERIQLHALALGFKKISVTKNASHEAILQVLKGLECDGRK